MCRKINAKIVCKYCRLCKIDKLWIDSEWWKFKTSKFCHRFCYFCVAQKKSFCYFTCSYLLENIQNPNRQLRAYITTFYLHACSFTKNWQLRKRTKKCPVNSCLSSEICFYRGKYGDKHMKFWFDLFAILCDVHLKYGDRHMKFWFSFFARLCDVHENMEIITHNFESILSPVFVMCT